MKQLVKNYFGIRLPFAFEGIFSRDEGDLAEILRVSGLKVTKQWEWSGKEVVSCESTDSNYQGKVTFMLSPESEVGCAFFEGDHRVDLAMSMTRAVSFLPPALIHLAARQCVIPEIRKYAIDILSLMYMREEEYSYWEPIIEKTTSVLWNDPDLEVVKQAFFIEATGNPALAGVNLKKRIDAETNNIYKTELLSLEDIAKRYQNADIRYFTDPLETEPRLAFPFMINDRLDDTLALFDGYATIVSDKTNDILNGSRLVELAPKNKPDSHFFFLAPKHARVACAYFTGPDAIEIAFGCRLYYFPTALARQVGWTSRFTDYSEVALLALAMANNNTILREKTSDPDFRKLLEIARGSKNKQIKETVAIINSSIAFM